MADKFLLQTIKTDDVRQAPIWLMRQAGRYLPEYRELRGKAPSFMEFCWNPKLTVAATLQPIERFDFDAAIIFSDILVIPHVLGQKVSFESGSGPKLEPIENERDFLGLSDELFLDQLGPVFDAVSEVRSKLDPGKSLIGFCGAPWTVASYMIAGHGTPDQAPARLFAYRNQDLFQRLIDLLVRCSIDYLCKQIDAGADVVQIFDSWAGVLPVGEFLRWSRDPIKRIVIGVRERHADAGIIVFARGGGQQLSYLRDLDGVDCLGLDTSVDLNWVKESVSPYRCVQGNLDPLVLATGGSLLDEGVDRIFEVFDQSRFIFNLGHGIIPQTPIENVLRLVDRVRANNRRRLVG